MRAGQWLVLSALVWLCVGPRVSIADFAGSSLRVEDLLLAAFAVLAVMRWSTARPDRRLRGIALVTGVSLLAAALGTALGHVHVLAGILYAVRPLEYWVVFPVALWLLRTGGPRARGMLFRVLAIATVVHSTVAAAQYIFGLDIGFSAFSVTRGAGLTNGPYELGAIMAMLLCLWMAQQRVLLAVLAFAGLVMSLSRISLIGAVVGVIVLGLIALRSRSSTRPESARSARPAMPKPTAVIVTTVAAVGLIVLIPTAGPALVAPTLERTQSTSLASAWQSGHDRAALVPPISSSDAYAAIAYGAIGTTVLERVTTSDASNEVRFYRWNLLIRQVQEADIGWVVGLGPSYAGPSVDGAYLRIIVEAGVLGLCAWGLMVIRWFKHQPAWFIGATTTLLVGNVFIDLFFAERPMVFFWVLLSLAGSGTAQRLSRQNEQPDPVMSV